MEYQKIINLLDDITNKPYKLEQEVELKQMMNHEERITTVMKSNLKLQ